ncbi:MAG: hypothetical protein LBI14_02015 [Treponema sp.]|nr:hypothetical protein [Treponema sp.]
MRESTATEALEAARAQLQKTREHLSLLQRGADSEAIALAEVRFIDVKSQYTPKDMQTSSMKNKVSVKVKLLLPSNTMLKPGNRVEVVFS